ncbi:MAG TPA: hypothetical protein VKD72_25695 [Gemmataceae bacterium]|nr:hypothetical protein [Gemmataceae bacterium]
MAEDFDSQYSDTPNGQKSGIDVTEPSYHPGQQSAAQAANPWDPALYPPDYTFDPIGFAKWKKEQSLLHGPEN